MCYPSSISLSITLAINSSAVFILTWSIAVDIDVQLEKREEPFLLPSALNTLLRPDAFELLYCLYKNMSVRATFREQPSSVLPLTRHEKPNKAVISFQYMHSQSMLKHLHDNSSNAWSRWVTFFLFYIPSKLLYRVFQWETPQRVSTILYSSLQLHY